MDNIKKEHVCEFCNKSFPSRGKLTNHYIKAQHEEMKYQCEICGIKCYTILSLHKHIKKQHDFNDYFTKYLNYTCSCEFCDVILTPEQYIKYRGACCNSHYNYNYKNKDTEYEHKYKCEICNIPYSSLRSLQKHIRDTHKFTIKDIENYYLQYINPKDNTKCKWCGKQTKFTGLTNGFQNFCYNSSCNINWYNQNTDRLSRAIKSNKKTVSRGDVLPSQLGYWIKKGFSEEEAKIKVSERQTTFSKEVCIEKYGEIKGLKRWKDRQNKWQKTLLSKPLEEREAINLKKIQLNDKSISNAEVELSNILKCNTQLSINREDNTNKFYLYDLYNENKIIEYNGDYWHCNPNHYDEDYYNASLDMTAKEKWKIDDDKLAFAISKGYDVLVIWEEDYKKNKEAIINECMEFLYE